MFINTINNTPENKLRQLLETLKSRYGFDLSTASLTRLNALAEKYDSVKKRIVAESSFNSYSSNPEYARAVLILEAVRLLIEVAPKRRKKSVKEGAASMKLQQRNATRNRRMVNEDEGLDQAETILAAKDLSDRLQKMAEDAAKMAVDDLMPLVDQMKSEFSIDQANAFNEVVKQNLQAVLDTIIKGKDETDNAIITLQGGGTPSMTPDIAQAPEAWAAPAPGGAGGEVDFEKEFAANPATSGPKEEPLGRAMKDEQGLAEGKKGQIPPQFLANIKKKKAQAGGKKPVKEGAMTCQECDTGVYEEDKNGRMKCNECGSTMVIGEGMMKNLRRGLSGWPSRVPAPGGEAGKPWDVLARVKKMNDSELKWNASRPDKDVSAGSPAALQRKAAQAELRRRGIKVDESNGKPTTDREKKLAAMAPPRDKITKADVLKGRGVIDEGRCPSCRKKPCVCESVNEADMDDKTPGEVLASMAVTGKDIKGRPLTPSQKQAAEKAAKELEKAPITEKARGSKNPYAVGMSQAKKEAGLGAKPAHDLPKKVITRAHDIARSIEKKEESQINRLNGLIEGLTTQYNQQRARFNQHKKSFARKLQEGKQIDPLGTGHGLEGDAILEKLSLLKNRIQEAKSLRQNLVNKINAQKQTVKEAKQEVKKFDSQLNSQPYGVVGISRNQRRVQKFFETVEQRTLWLEYNQENLKETRMIDPSTIENAKKYLNSRIKK